MISKNSIIFYDSTKSSLIEIYKAHKEPRDYNIDINSVSANNIQSICNICYRRAGLILTFDGRVYTKKDVEWIPITLPETIIKISYVSPFLVAFSNSKVYLINKDNIDDYKVWSIKNEAIVDFVKTNLVLTESGTIYQLGEDPNPIITDVQFASIHHLHYKHALAISVDGYLYVIFMEHCQRLIYEFESKNQFIFKPLCLSGMISGGNYVGTFRLYLFTVDNKIIVFDYSTDTGKYIYLSESIKFPPIDVVHAINIPDTQIVVDVNGRVYDLYRRKYIEYFDTDPVLGQNQKKSARC